MFDFINSLFKMKSGLKLTQLSIKASVICRFSFSFKLNEKKNAVKKTVWRGGIRKSLLEGGLGFNRGVENILEKEELTRKG